MQIVGSLAIVVACLSIALGKIASMKRVYRCLRQLDLTVKEIRASLASLQSPISDLLLSADRTDGETGRFFRAVRDGMSGLCEHSFSEIWKKDVQEHLSILPEKDRDALISLGAFLGRFDLEDQLSACDRWISGSAESIRSFEARIPEAGRLYLALGGSAGVFLCLWIL